VPYATAIMCCCRANGAAAGAPKVQASSSSLSGDSGEMDEAELFGGMDIDETQPVAMQVKCLLVLTCACFCV